MAIYGTFVYGSATYGDAVDITNIDLLSKTLVLIEFNDELVVNSAYKDVDNYSISVVSGKGPVRILRVLEPKEKSSLSVILVTDPMTPGTRYSISVSGLSNRSGQKALGSGDVIARETKEDGYFRSIPQHFDKRPESILGSLGLSIARQDDILGGSRSDTFDYGESTLVSGEETTDVEIDSHSGGGTITSATETVTGTYRNADKVFVIIDGLSSDAATLTPVSSIDGTWSVSFTSDQRLSDKNGSTVTMRAVALDSDGGYDEHAISITLSI